jgi:hypothetical protein
VTINKNSGCISQNIIFIEALKLKKDSFFKKDKRSSNKNNVWKKVIYLFFEV